MTRESALATKPIENQIVRPRFAVQGNRLPVLNPILGLS